MKRYFIICVEEFDGVRPVLEEHATGAVCNYTDVEQLERELVEVKIQLAKTQCSSDQLMLIIEGQDANYLRMLSSLDEMDKELKYYKARDYNGETVLEYHERELLEARSKVEEWQSLASTQYQDLAEKQEEINRLRAIPLPPEPQQTNSEGWQIWHSCVQHYESQIREQKSTTPPN